MPHVDAVYRAAVALSGGTQDAEDLTQTTVLKALEALDSFRPGGNCRAWLLRILRNTWLDALRRRRSAGTSVHIEEELLAAAEPAQQTAWTNPRDLLENFSDDQVIKALAELPEEQRLALYLVDVEQLQYREAAEIMGAEVGTIKSRASRARSALKERLVAKARDLGFIGRVKP